MVCHTMGGKSNNKKLTVNFFFLFFFFSFYTLVVFKCLVVFVSFEQMMYLYLCLYIICSQAQTEKEGVLQVEFMYLVFTRMSGESYRKRLRSLYTRYVFRELINSLVC